MDYERSLTTAERLRAKLDDLSLIDERIRIAEEAKKERPELLIEIVRLYRQLSEEEGIK